MISRAPRLAQGPDRTACLLQDTEPAYSICSLGHFVTLDSGLSSCDEAQEQQRSRNTRCARREWRGGPQARLGADSALRVSQPRHLESSGPRRRGRQSHRRPQPLTQPLPEHPSFPVWPPPVPGRSPRPCAQCALLSSGNGIHNMARLSAVHQGCSSGTQECRSSLPPYVAGVLFSGCLL